MSTAENPLIPDQRREHLMRLLHREPVLSVHQLTEALGVSHMTIRRDISTLEREGRAYSVPGGVRLATGSRSEPTYVAKAEAETQEKAAIAAAAAALLHDDMVLYLDAGTTVTGVVGAVGQLKNVTVITNDFAIVDRLTPMEHVETIHIGGRLEHSNRSTIGRLAAETLQRLNIDLAFISASSWDITRGVTTPTEGKVEVKVAALASSAATALLVTSSKLGTFGIYDIAPLRRFDEIITDWHLPYAAADGIRDLGVKLTIAHPVMD